MLKLEKTDERPAQPVALIVTLLVSIVLGVAFELLFGERVNGISVPLFVAAAVSGLFLVLQVGDRKPKWSEYWIVAPLLFFSGMIAVRASDDLKALNTVVIFVLLILLVYVAVGKKMHELRLAEYLMVPLSFFSFIGRSFDALKEVPALRRGHEKKMVIKSVVKGALLALPFLFIFLILFSSADSIFGTYVGDGWKSLVDMRAWSRILVVAVVTLFFIGAFHTAHRAAAKPANSGVEDHGTHEIATVATFLGVINLLFLAFVVIQIRYLFGGEADLQQFGLTYADYARKGFFELVGVAAISFITLLALEKGIVKKAGGHTSLFKWFGAVHVLLVIAIVYSAHQRLGLYEQAYGFTVARFFAHGLIFWLATVFLLLLAKILGGSHKTYFAFPLFVSVLVFLGIANVVNPDAFVAARNLEQYRQTGKIDAWYLGHLSADAVPLTVVLLDDANAEIRDAYAESVRDRVFGYARVSQEEERSSFQEEEWPSFNMARSKARAILQAKDDAFFNAAVFEQP